MPQNLDFLPTFVRFLRLLVPLAVAACGDTAEQPSNSPASSTATSSDGANASTGSFSTTTSNVASTTSSSSSGSIGGGSGVSEGSVSSGGGATATESSATTVGGTENVTSTEGGGGTAGSAPTDTPVQKNGKLRVDGTRLVNESGVAVQLKGPSSMWLHWEEDGYAESLEALEWMRDNWNLSVIRAAMGVEPEGAYLTDPEQMRQQMTTIVDNAIQAGVYVIIDWHDHNAHEHQSEAEQFFADMAAQYGDTPNVLYEPYNEPVQVDWASVVKPYHEALVATIRNVDPDNLIILGTPNWSQYVDEAAADPVAGTNLLYTLHFYSCSHTDWLRDLGNTALGLGAALFVTEWGATDADGGLDGLVCLEEAQLWHDWMAQHGVSWTAWKLDNCEDSSCYFGPDGAPLEGGWTDAQLQGHAPFVRDRMLE